MIGYLLLFIPENDLTIHLIYKKKKTRHGGFSGKDFFYVRPDFS